MTDKAPAQRCDPGLFCALRQMRDKTRPSRIPPLSDQKAVRPSEKYPTLELRAPDCCTSLDDAISLACLFRVLARHLFRNQDLNSAFGAVGRCIAVENKWHAQRFGVEGVFASETGPVSVAKMLDDVIAITAEDASVLGCSSEVERCRAIIADGTSAHKQLNIFREQRHLGTDVAEHSRLLWTKGSHRPHNGTQRHISSCTY